MLMLLYFQSCCYYFYSKILQYIIKYQSNINRILLSLCKVIYYKLEHINIIAQNKPVLYSYPNYLEKISYEKITNILKKIQSYALSMLVKL